MSELEERVARLEGEVAELRDRVELTRQVAGLQDSDLADVRLTLTAHTRLLQALADVQSQQTRTLHQHGDQLTTIHDALQTMTGMLQVLIDREGPA